MKPRPVLRLLIQTFTTLTSGLDVVILAGTGLSQSDVDDTMSSGIMKLSRHQLCHDTGAFEGWEGRNGMSSWVKMFVPDWILEGPDRKRLEERMGSWLKGRYRQHNLLLNAYIQERIGAGLRGVNLEPRDKPDFTRLEKNTSRMIKIDLLPLDVMRSIFFCSLGDDERLWIEYGFGRLRRDSNTRGSVLVFYEPLIVAAANYWFSKKLDLNYKYFASRIGGEPKKLNQVFNFKGVVPLWAKKRAKLVSVYISPTGSHSGAPSVDDVNHPEFSGPSAVLGTYTENG
ncbi:hypothetical protein APHAL10511_004148 [Amanita phalloides]|nr:hypothetical protein APHAL10511_004148 [Amanita phalloides]